MESLCSTKYINIHSDRGNNARIVAVTFVVAHQWLVTTSCVQGVVPLPATLAVVAEAG